MRPAAALTAIAAILLGTTAQAATPCWSPAEIGAARVQELEAMLMGVSLRCRASVAELPDRFERFRDNHKLRLESAFRLLGAHFDASGSRQGKLALDRFLIQQSNRFGGGRSDLPTCRGFAAVLARLGAPGSVGDPLETFALAMVRDPYLDGPRCPARGATELAMPREGPVSGGQAGQ